MRKPKDPTVAIEGIISIIMIVDIIYLISFFFFVENFKFFSMVVILTNLGLLLLRVGYKKDIKKVEDYLSK